MVGLEPRGEQLAVVQAAGGSSGSPVLTRNPPPRYHIEAPEAPAAPPRPTVQPEEGGIIYSRVPRTTGCHDLVRGNDGNVLENVCHLDFKDALPDVVRDNGDFNAPGQLVWLKEDGTEVLIYDCYTDRQPCVPFDSMVSPDGTKVAFSVYWSNNLEQGWLSKYDLPNTIIGNEEGNWSVIHIYDLRTGELTRWPHNGKGGRNDAGPAWLGNDRIVFTSNARGYQRPQIRSLSPRYSPEARLFTAKVDGSDRRDIGQHDVSGALHPYVHSSGRIFYSLHRGSHNLMHGGTNGGINTTGTQDNQWVLAHTDSDGGDFAVAVGMHAKGAFGDTMKAIHFLGQRVNGDMCFSDYYRKNNFGLGQGWCFPMQPNGIEGPAPDFLPRGLYRLTTWAVSGDVAVFDGKVGWPDGMLDGQVLLTLGRGLCTHVNESLTRSPERVRAQSDSYVKFGCNTGIYRTTRIPSRDMQDLAVVVDRPEWHEFNARVIKAREIRYAPMQTSSNGSCQMLSADVHASDALNYYDYDFNEIYRFIDGNGSQLYGVDPADVVAVRFWQVKQNVPGTSWKDVGRSSIGNKVRLLGDVPVLADNSLRVALPCDTPIIMGGVDSEGRLVRRDQLPQSLRPGELRTCSGCHLHGSMGKSPENTLAWHVGPVVLDKPSPVPTFNRDIAPLLQKHCSECHADGSVPIDNYHDLVWDFFQAAVPSARKVQVSDSSNPNRQFGLQRPQSSKYVNTMYARKSLLYWCAAGERTDGMRDASYGNDIDFGRCSGHERIPDEDLRELALWLDSGAPES
ncbi:hypothetical protein [Parahaliea mediterranea]|uniref:Hydrazine synthase alpha subunit middle domain-containing protein n=1 Tax=Parahaliea mediterranea TaxID=651086 RepID=A0A939DFC7_9GAMM|nr:hypothetical protein [Parahaliea mediterranea]MBN7796856.1 hypothetical protein [Parahaliea mediterranea]